MYVTFTDVSNGYPVSLTSFNVYTFDKKNYSSLLAIVLIRYYSHRYSEHQGRLLPPRLKRTAGRDSHAWRQDNEAAGRPHGKLSIYSHEYFLFVEKSVFIAHK